MRPREYAPVLQPPRALRVSSKWYLWSRLHRLGLVQVALISNWPALGDFKILSIIGAAASAMGHSIIDLIPEKIAQLLGLLLRDVNSITPRREMTEGIY